MSLYPSQTRRSPHFLALAAAHDVRLFTLSLRELNSKAISVNLTALYRIALESPPDYLLTLRPVPNGELYVACTLWSLLCGDCDVSHIGPKAYSDEHYVGCTCYCVPLPFSATGAVGAISQKGLVHLGPAGHAPHLLVANHHGYVG